MNVPRAMFAEDFESEFYVMRRPSLVVFMAMDSPRGTKEHSKAKAMVTDQDSVLLNREVDVDMKILDEFFRKQVTGTSKPEIKRFVNHERREIFEEIDNIKAQNYDAFYFVILSFLDKDHHHHHDEDSNPGFKVQFYDKSIEISELMDRVKRRPEMALKPKVFIVQADDLDLLTPNIICKATPSGPGIKEQMVKIPTDADQLLLISTIPQELGLATQVAHSAHGIVTHPAEQEDRARQENNGQTQHKNSWLIQAFVQVLQDHTDLDLFSNTPLINNRVEELYNTLELGNEFKNVEMPVPYVYSTLTRFLFVK